MRLQLHLFLFMQFLQPLPLQLFLLPILFRVVQLPLRLPFPLLLWPKLLLLHVIPTILWQLFWLLRLPLFSLCLPWLSIFSASFPSQLFLYQLWLITFLFLFLVSFFQLLDGLLLMLILRALFFKIMFSLPIIDHIMPSFPSQL